MFFILSDMTHIGQWFYVNNLTVTFSSDNTVHLEEDGRTKLRKRGILSYQINGTWWPLCIASREDMVGQATDICKYLGFRCLYILYYIFYGRLNNDQTSQIYTNANFILVSSN